MRRKDVYPNGSSRGGTPGRATDTTQHGRSPKNYEKNCVTYWGGYSEYEASVDAIRKAVK